MASIVMAIRRFRDGRAAAVGLAILVLVSAVCAAAAPRLLDRAANDALRGEVAAASGFDRNIQLIQVRRYGDVSDPLGGVVDEGADLMRVMPASVQDLIASRAYVIEGLRWAVQNKTKTRKGKGARLTDDYSKWPGSTVKGSLGHPLPPRGLGSCAWVWADAENSRGASHPGARDTSSFFPESGIEPHWRSETKENPGHACG